MASRYIHPSLAREMAETVSLHIGKAVECRLKFDHGLRRDTARGPRVLFTLTDERKLWVDPPVADRIEAAARPGEPFWICKRKMGSQDIYDVWTGGRQRVDPDQPQPEWENSFKGAEAGRPGPTEARLDPDATEDMVKMARSIDQANAHKAALRQARQRSEGEAAVEAALPRCPNCRDTGSIGTLPCPTCNPAIFDRERARQAAAAAAPPARTTPPAIAAPAGDGPPSRNAAWDVIEQSTKDAIDVLATVRQHAQQYGLLIEAEDARSLICTMIIGRQQRGAR